MKAKCKKLKDGHQKQHFSAYYGIKFKLKMMNMMMIMVIILMLDDDNAQKSSTNMTLWSKYTSFSLAKENLVESMPSYRIY